MYKLTAKDGTYYLVQHFREGKDVPGPWSPTGGETHVVLVDDHGEPLKTEAGEEILGIAYCLPTDNYSRPLGRLIALGRALKMRETGKAQEPRWFER